MKKLPPITILGTESQGGTYLLRLRVTQSLQLSFGRFKKGKMIMVPAGTYVYIGSALGNKGAMSLGRRLVRHATRADPQAPHALRPHLLETCQAVGLGQGDLRPKRGKRLFWNVDHLLDQPAVSLTHIIAIRSQQRLEAQLGQWLENEPVTRVIEKGLGANDVTGNTHLLRVVGDETWWAELPDKCQHLVDSHR